MMISWYRCWVMAPAFGFSMQYTINFENATAIFDIAQKNQLVVVQDGKREAISVRDGMGYEYEIDCFLMCVAQKTPPSLVTIPDAAVAIVLLKPKPAAWMAARLSRYDPSLLRKICAALHELFIDPVFEPGQELRFPSLCVAGGQPSTTFTP